MFQPRERDFAHIIPKGTIALECVHHVLRNVQCLAAEQAWDVDEMQYWLRKGCFSAWCDAFQQILAQAMRFTPHTINADLVFGDDHENRQESIFKLLLNYLWGFGGLGVWSLGFGVWDLAVADWFQVRSYFHLRFVQR